MCQVIKFFIFLKILKIFIIFFVKIYKLSRVNLLLCHVVAYNHDMWQL